MRAFVIVDLGFGDAGKGLLTDFLVRRTGARLVVRYNGGPQAGHNVVTPDGRHHTFSQFGSGTLLPGVRTFLSRDVVVHPTALLREEAQLRSIGVTDAFERIGISEHALVITPYHQAAGRLRELARGKDRHGSCGIGFGEAVSHARAAPENAIRVGDLADELGLRPKLKRICDQKRAELSSLDLSSLTEARRLAEMGVFEQESTADRWIASATRLTDLVADDASWANVSERDSTVVFEGAHGALLDEWNGFHPYTTWNCCTTASALSLLSECAPGTDVRTIGVLRAYAVRHGPGPLPTESADVLYTPPEHNNANEWQGEVRRGWFDSVLARYGAVVAGEIDALAITHLDWLPSLAKWSYCDTYEPVVTLVPSSRPSREPQGRLASLLAAARPVLCECPPAEPDVLERIADMVGRDVAIGSRGPSATDVFVRPGNALGLPL